MAFTSVLFFVAEPSPAGFTMSRQKREDETCGRERVVALIPDVTTGPDSRKALKDENPGIVNVSRGYRIRKQHPAEALRS
jgi:hypothetical protein